MAKNRGAAAPELPDGEPAGPQALEVQAAGGPLELRVTQHPGHTFYKDEGGKTSHLAATVRVENTKDPKVVGLGCKVWITPTLCYENGNPVEDGPEFFKILSMEPKAVTTTEQRVTVKFRIEKVSRRKDGQRFKVRFDVDQSKTPLAMPGAYTSAICVLSKRKFRNPHAGNRVGTPQKKATASPSASSSSYNSATTCSQQPAKRAKSPSSVSGSNASSRRAALPIAKADATEAAMLAMRKTIAMLESKVGALVNRVTTLESEQTVLRDSLKRSRQEFEESSSDHLAGSDCSVSGASPASAPGVAPATAEILNLNKFKLDYGDEDVLLDMDDFNMEPTRPFRSSMAFDFGIPSSASLSEPSFY